LVLGLRWLDTALDFPIDALGLIPSSAKPEHFMTPSWPQNALSTAELGLALDPTLSLQISTFPESPSTRHPFLASKIPLSSPPIFSFYFELTASRQPLLFLA
jgi:hypothetical protein